MHPYDFSALVAHFLEQQCDAPQNQNIGTVLKKYNVYHGANWVINQVHIGIPYLRQRSVAHKEVFEIDPAGWEAAQNFILETVGATVIDADHQARRITTDATALSLIPLPNGWTFARPNGAPVSINATKEFANVSKDITKYQDQFAVIDHDEEAADAVIEALEMATTAIRQSNIISEVKKRDIVFDLELGLSLIRKAGKVSIGALKYLVLDRLEEAYKNAAEEFLKDAIKVAFFALGLYLIGAIRI